MGNEYMYFGAFLPPPSSDELINTFEGSASFPGFCPAKTKTKKKVAAFEIHKVTFIRGF